MKRLLTKLIQWLGNPAATGSTVPQARPRVEELESRVVPYATTGNLWPHPRLNALTPTGAKAGSILEVTFAGTDTEMPESLWFSHAGIKGTPIIPPLPPVDPKAKVDPAKKIEPPPVTKFSVVIGAAPLFDVA